MAVDILAGIGAFKSMYDAAKALKDMNAPVAVISATASPRRTSAPA